MRARAGLQGCGVDTVTASIGTSVNITFMVFDRHMPAASASLTKTVTVISPCALRELYCPGADPACGDGPCAVRSARVSDAAEEERMTADDTQLRAGAVLRTHTGYEVVAICGYPLAVEVRPCVAAAKTASCLILSSAAGASVQQHQSACSSDGMEAGTCSLCAIDTIQRGGCPVSTQQLTYYSPSAVASHRINVTITELIAEASATFNVSMSISEAVNATELLQGGMVPFSLAAAVQAAALQSVAAHAATPGGPCRALQPYIASDVAMHASTQLTTTPNVGRSVRGTVALSATLRASVAFGVAVRLRTAAQVHAELPRAPMETCLVTALGSGVNASSINAALAAEQSVSHGPAVVTRWQASASRWSSAGSAGACAPLTQQQLREEWLVASSEALETDMQHIDTKVRLRYCGCISISRSEMRSASSASGAYNSSKRFPRLSSCVDAHIV